MRRRPQRSARLGGGAARPEVAEGLGSAPGRLARLRAGQAAIDPAAVLAFQRLPRPLSQSMARRSSWTALTSPRHIIKLNLNVYNFMRKKKKRNRACRQRGSQRHVFGLGEPLNLASIVNVGGKLTTVPFSRLSTSNTRGASVIVSRSCCIAE